MKVILLNGSPKSKGCTYTALKIIENELINEGIEVKFYEVGNKPVIGCTGCTACRKLGKCVHNDLVNEVSKESTWRMVEHSLPSRPRHWHCTRCRMAPGMVYT